MAPEYPVRVHLPAGPDYRPKEGRIKTVVS